MKEMVKSLRTSEMLGVVTLILPSAYEILVDVTEVNVNV